MPGMSGIELLGKVMASGKPCPVILATGHGGAALRERAETLGATAFLEKPFRPAQLQKAICAILDQDARE
jgi:FixJ family two-component response regulator